MSSKIPEDLVRILEDIVAYEALEKYLEEPEEDDLLYAEIPVYYYEDEEDTKESWKIEINL